MPAADDPTSIGNVLIELGFCTQGDIDGALAAMEQQRIGETLIAMGVINGNQLDHALMLQRIKRRQTSPQEEREFIQNQRSALLTELSEMHVSTFAFVEKINGGG